MNDKRWLLLAGAALLLIGLTIFLWPASNSDKAQTGGTTIAAGGEDNDDSSAKLRKGRGTDNSSWIAGIVVDRDSKLPLEGARIAMNLRRLDNGLSSTAGIAPAPRVATSDAEGRFRFPELGSGQYSVSIAHAGYMPLSQETQIHLKSEPAELRFEMAKGGHRLFGKVTDIGGGAVAFALVRAKNFSNFNVSSVFRAPFSAMTNAQGEYELFLGDGRYQVEVFHENYRSEKQRIGIGGQDRKADFVLTPGSGIDGQVLRESDDSPVEGAMVTWTKLGKTRGFTISGIGFHGSALTDAEGRFSLRGLGNGSVELRAVSAHAANEQPTIVDLAIAETASDVTVYVQEAFTLSGHVVSSNDEEAPESGVIVGAYNISPGAVFASNVPSDDEGYFEIHGVHPGHYTVGAAGEERLPNFFGSPAQVIDQDIENLVITVDHGNTLSGRVSPPQETNLALQIDVAELGFSTILGAASSALVNGRSDAEGNFVLHGVGEGTFTLVATSDTGDEGKLEIEVTGDQDGLIVLIETRAIATGRVVDSDGAPVEGVRVDFSALEQSTSRSFTANGLAKVTMTGSDGSWRYTGLKAGKYEVSVHDKFQLPWAGGSSGKNSESKNYAPIPVEIREGQNPPAMELVIEARSHWIAGTVLDASGVALPDSWVTARWVDDDENLISGPRRRQNNRPVLTDDTGAFRMEGLRSGRYRLWVSAMHGHAKGGAKNVAVDTNINIKVDALGTIKGSVTLAGEPINDFLLSVVGPTKRRLHVRDSSGTFSVPKLEAGKYTLSCSSDKGVATGSLVVKSGEVATHNFSLSTFGAVFGTLVDSESGDPLADMAVFATVGKDRNDLAASAVSMLDGSGPRTNEKGEFRIERLNAGDGSLMIFDPDAIGFAPLVNKDFSLEIAQSLDLGTLEAVRSPEQVPPEREP